MSKKLKNCRTYNHNQLLPCFVKLVQMYKCSHWQYEPDHLLDLKQTGLICQVLFVLIHQKHTQILDIKTYWQEDCSTVHVTGPHLREMLPSGCDDPESGTGFLCQQTQVWPPTLTSYHEWYFIHLCVVELFFASLSIFILNLLELTNLKNK